MSSTPIIRFRGYTDAWKQRKLGDKMYIKARIGWQALTKKEYLDSGDYYLITGTDIDESSHSVDLSRCFYVSKERYEMDDKIQVHEGDIIVTKDGTIGKVAMVTGLNKPATLNSHLFVLRDMSGNLDNRFLLHLLSSNIFDDFIESTKTGSTLTGMPQKTFVEFSFLAPSLEEQKKISHYIDNLNDLIVFHQSKHAKLLNYKSAIADKIFPSIEQQPTLRTVNKGSWRKVSLSEIGDYFNTDSLGYADLAEDGKYKCLLYGDLYTKYNEKIINVKSRTNKPVTKLVKGDILFPASTTVDAISLIAPSSVCEDGIYAGGDLFGIRPKTDISGTFISYYINNKHSLKSSLSKNAQGLTIVHVHYDNIKDEKIMLPEYDEQIAIVSLFTALDNLIESEKSYIDKLKIIKQAFLSKMFVEVEA